MTSTLMHPRAKRDALIEPAERAPCVVEPLIRLVGVDKVYRTGKLEYRALRSVDLEIAAGEMVAVVGPSGSGKTTVMNMITGIDRPSGGEVVVDGEPIHAMRQEKLAAWRGRNVGIVFQFFQLLPTLTALENAMLPLDFARQGSKRERRRRAPSSWNWWGLATSWIIFRPSFPVASSSGWRLRVRWLPIRSF
jgi:putative ABC transport system ATP-binding protein